MRSWLSLFVLAPALLAQTAAPAVLLPAASPDAFQKLEQRFDGLTPAPAAQGNFSRFQAPTASKVLIGNPVPHPIVIPAGRIAVKALTKTCSIPLINVLKGKALDKMAVPPRPSKEFFAPGNYVTPPAPPCDDEKR